MNNRQLMDLLEEIEAEFPVETWVIDGLHVWPLVRYDVMTRNREMFTRLEASSTPKSRLERLRRSAPVTMAEDALRGLRARRQDETSNAEAKASSPVDVLLYSDGISFVQLDGIWVDRFLDPLTDVLRERGLSSLMVTPKSTYFVPRRTPSLFIQPQLDAVTLRSNVVARLRRGRHVAKLDRFEEARAAIRRRKDSLVVADEAQLARVVVYVHEYARYFERLLRTTKARLAFNVCYYGGERFAMQLACRKLGITSIDVQHGGAGDAHWAYRRWVRVPPGGYALLPDVFWCWSDLEHADILSWSERLGGLHRPIVGGNLFMDTWQQDDVPYVQRYLERVRAVRSQHPEHRHVLVTMSGLETDEQLTSLAKAIAASADHWFWWVRCHPTRLEKRAAVEAALRAAGASRVAVSEATEMPLYALLRCVDAHVTEYSSTVIEAAKFGVPSVMIGLDQAVDYPDLLESGWMLPVANVDAVVPGLDAQVDRWGRDRESTNASPPPRVRPEVAELLDRVRR